MPFIYRVLVKRNGLLHYASLSLSLMNAMVFLIEICPLSRQYDLPVVKLHQLLHSYSIDLN